MPTHLINGIELHYQYHRHDAGTASPLLMLAGMASDGASWQPVVKPLSAHHDLLIPDNRCTGQSIPNPITTNRALMVSDVLRLLDALGIERVKIVGHSMGGMLGWALAAQAPERVELLVSAAAMPFVIPARVALFNSLAALRTTQNEAQWFELLYQFLFQPHFFQDSTVVKAAVAASMSYPHKQSAQAFAEQVHGLSSFLSAPDLSALSCPVTMLTGRHDILMTPTMLTQYARELSATNACIIDTCIIEDAAHALHWEQPQAFVDCVLQAINKQSVNNDSMP